MDQVEEIKAKTDIVQIISEYVDLKKAGRHYKGLCPFHTEKTPSFMVSPELQIYKCFGCSEGGDVISFLQKHEGMDFAESLKYLADRAGVKLEPFKGQGGEEKEKLRSINYAAGKLYQYMLLKHKSGQVALQYLKKQRGLRLPTINKFEIGFSPNDPTIISKFLTQKKGFKVQDLITAGLVYRQGRDVYDRFRGRIMFPLHDHRGNVIGFAGRILPGGSKGLPAGRQVAKYVNTHETVLYQKSKVLYGLNFTKGDIKRAGSAVICEGELDVISSYASGVKNVVASKGTALTEDQLRLLGRFSDHLILALDSDKAGDTAATRAIEIAQRLDIEVTVALLGEYKDPDEIAQKDPKLYKKYLRSSKNVWDFLIDNIFEKYDLSGTGKAKISKSVIPILMGISDDIVQAHYIKQVADRLSVSTQVILQQMAKTPEKAVSEVESSKQKEKKEKSRQRLLEEQFFSLLFQSDPKVLQEKEIQKLIKTRILKKLLKHYLSFQKGSKEFDLAKFGKSLPNELKNAFSELIFAEDEKLLEYPDRLEREVNKVITELKSLAIKSKLHTLQENIKKYEKSGSKSSLTKAEKRFSLLSSNLSDLSS